MAKKKTTPKFADKSQKAGLLVRQCPECSKYHHPRAAKCPNCGHTYPAKKKTGGRKIVKKKPGAKKTATATTSAAGRDDRLQAAISLVAACRGSVSDARQVLDTIDRIKKL